jgi:hypothetical protein
VTVVLPTPPFWLRMATVRRAGLGAARGISGDPATADAAADVVGTVE